jgi:hypothetical protein
VTREAVRQRGCGVLVDHCRVGTGVLPQVHNAARPRGGLRSQDGEVGQAAVHRVAPSSVTASAADRDRASAITW